MNIDTSLIEKYYLVDVSHRPSNARIKSVNLTKKEAQLKNYALTLRNTTQRYIKQKDWK